MTLDLNALIKDYDAHHKQALREYLEESIQNASAPREDNSLIFGPHQKRLHGKKQPENISNLTQELAKLEQCTDFETLLDAVGKTFDIGDCLWAYDIALRIAYKVHKSQGKDIFPKKLHVYRGALVGAKAMAKQLGIIPDDKKRISKAALEKSLIIIQHVFQSLGMEIMDIENMLCIYKEYIDNPQSGLSGIGCPSKKKIKSCC